MSKGCQHPSRESLEGDLNGRVKCLDCGRKFRPRGAPVYHGTYLGYCRHNSVKEGEWSWPPCPQCAQAGTDWRREYTDRGHAIDSRHRRGAARARALNRLRAAYAGVFAEFYAEEMEERGGRSVRQRSEIPAWDGVIARLVKAATGRGERDMDCLMKSGEATALEADVMRQVRRLRIILANLEGRRGA